MHPNRHTPAYNAGQMSAPQPIDQIAERVERLLLRHAELLRAHQLLRVEADSLRQERDLLRQQCHGARQRLDALIASLPPLPQDGPAP